MPCNQTGRNPKNIFQPIASFDRLGLPVEQPPSKQPVGMDEVAFQRLQLKRLLESAFQLQGFNQATASSHTEDRVVVEYASSEGLYRSFQNQPVELKMQLIVAPVRALACVA